MKKLSMIFVEKQVLWESGNTVKTVVLMSQGISGSLDSSSGSRIFFRIYAIGWNPPDYSHVITTEL